MTHDVRPPGSAMKTTLLVLILSATLTLALVMRLWGLTSEPVWLDEVYSVLLSDGPSDQILEANAKDVHPPAYYLGLGRWRQVFGSTPAGIRGYSILWSLIGVTFVVLLAIDSGLDWHGVSFAGMLAAINPMDIYFAQEARMYAQATALATASSWMLWRWLQSRRVSGSQLAQGAWLSPVRVYGGTLASDALSRGICPCGPRPVRSNRPELAAGLSGPDDLWRSEPGHGSSGSALAGIHALLRAP